MAGRAVGVTIPTITAEMLAAVDAAYPCGERRRRYHVGQSVAEVTFEDACWVERYAPAAAALIRAEGGVPLWALAGDGSGYGSGYGYGSGSGDGSGYGSGEVVNA